jgi:endonuclease/exonuclease/phosphatase (EEP) superfamily protein YafD
MLRTILYFGVAVACIWVIADSLFGLENSWILFFVRVFSPLLFLSSIGIVCIACLVSLRWPLTVRPFFSWRYALIVIACTAPTVRSLVLVHSSTQTLPASPSPSSQLRLLNLNALGFTDLSKVLLKEIEDRNPDVVTLQEVNPQMAEALRTHLSQRYPCQILDPVPDSWGMGIISKLPCSALPVPSDGHWVGKPQLVELRMIGGRKVLVANIHSIHPHAPLEPEPDKQGSLLTSFSQTVKAREAAIQQVLDTIAATSEKSAVIAGDLNATMRNTVYEKIRAAGYTDSWLTNHSFMRGSTWPSLATLGVQLPAELFRIDFVFHSEGLRTIHSQLLSTTLGSDHIGMLVVMETA